MTPEFGDIIDCRDVPSLGHFIISLGIKSKRGNEELMYYMVTSRVYTVFKEILTFFNDCIDKDYKRFYVHFSKERPKEVLRQHGNLCDAFFLDHKTHYDGCLTTDSLILLKEEPSLMDNATFQGLYKNKMVKFKGRLCTTDLVKLIEMIKLSSNVGVESRSVVCRNYKLLKQK